MDRELFGWNSARPYRSAEVQKVNNFCIIQPAVEMIGRVNWGSSGLQFPEVIEKKNPALDLDYRE